jgi:hypothetical protein
MSATKLTVEIFRSRRLRTRTRRALRLAEKAEKLQQLAVTIEIVFQKCVPQG